MDDLKPRLALDMYVLAQGVKTGVYRVCDELFPRLSRSEHLDVRLFYRDGDHALAAAWVEAHDIPARCREPARRDGPSPADVLLSPFGAAPADWLMDPGVLKTHIIYDLIAIRRPEYFSQVAAAEVKNIIDSLDEFTVVFVISEFTKKDLLASRPDLNPRQVTVVPLAAGASFKPCGDAGLRRKARAKYAIPPDVPYVLSLATLEIRKNLDQVVNAFVMFLEQNPDSRMHLVLSGMSGWKLEQLQAALSEAEKWRHRIVLTGFVDDADLSALYSDARCFIYMSRYEGFGLPPLEAMACGTPVICADNSSLPEVVGEAGVLLDADDVSGVAEAIRQIDASEAYRADLTQSGLRQAALFSWDQCAEIMVETIRAAHRRHVQRPFNRGRLFMFPGAQADRFRRPDGVVEANIIDYRNGSQGPHFGRLDSVPHQRADADWPRWDNALPLPPGATRVEGGLRSRGIVKSGEPGRPLISYVTVVRNNTATLARTIESVQAQTYGNVEHIVLDGASTDGTVDLILQYRDKLDYFASESDAGLYDAINKAIPLARGQLICVLNSDDWLEPDAAEIAALRMGDAIDSTMLLTAARVQGSDRLHEWYPSFVHPGCYFMCANDCHNGIYATRAAYERSGPYDTTYKIVADFKWIMACLESDVTFVYTRETTVNYSLGGTSGDVQRHSIECMRVVSERFPFLSQDDVQGLYHCLFFFGGQPSVPGRPENRTHFLKDIFSRYRTNPDFIRALTWASFDSLRHPADLPPTSAPAPVIETRPPSVKRAVKDVAKAVLSKHPSAYSAAERFYAILRR